MHSDLGNKSKRNTTLDNRLHGMPASIEGLHLRDVLNGSGEPSTEADVIERLMILATSIAINSRQQSLLHSFTILLRSLLETIEGDELASFGATYHPADSIGDAKKVGKSPSALTKRQREVLRLRSLGLGVVAIAERLNLTPRTVHSHIRDAIERLGVSGGAMAAVAEARRLGLI